MNEKPDEITLSSTLVFNPGLVLREEEDGALLFDPETGEVRILNQSAAAICKLFDGRRSIAEIVTMLGESFERMAADADEEVLALARDLHRIGAIGTMAELP